MYKRQEDAQALILPGVGAFGDAMEALCSRGFPDAIRAFLESGRPFLGICLGMQLLLDSSEESPGVEGLHILKGTVRRFPSDMGLKAVSYTHLSRHLVNHRREVELCQIFCSRS